MPSVSASTQTVLDFIAAINAADLERIHSLMTDGHVFVDALGNRFAGAGKMTSGWQHFFHTYPDYTISAVDTIGHGDDVAVFGSASGKWRVGESVLPQGWTVRAAWHAVVEAGHIASWSVYCDTGWATPPKQG